MSANLYDFPSRPSVAGKDNGGASGGDGGGGNVLEPRVAKLESHVEHIQRDTTDIKQKLERVADDVSDLKVSMAALAGRQDAFDIKLDTMDKKSESKLDALGNHLESKLDALDKKFEVKFDALDKKFDLRLDALDKKFDAKFDGLDKKFATKADLHEAQVKQQQWMFRTMLTLISLGVGLTGAIVAALFKYMPQ
ncbi:hypothetical protein OR620_07735 [Aeromonas hydrophila]|uniref:hypothetical protein n=1 Tax=Aeromonas hydrophila TaxID=644 RepID=UPI001117B45C|nr:hypothetical protein [Aeromonas hydrophila]MCX4103670.1 hypothetical protein [Aeromonas hydrophila]